jgi:hypothetical protein
MAFPTVAEMNQYLKVRDNSEMSLIELYLDAFEDYLASVGMSFNNEVKTIKFEPREPKTIFKVEFCQSITSFKMKQYDSANETVLVEGVDYKVSRHIEKPHPIFRVDMLKQQVTYPSYLELSGVFGWGSELPIRLKTVLVRLLKAYLKETSTDGQIIKSSSTGDSSVTFETSNSSKESALEFDSQSALQDIIASYIPL